MICGTDVEVSASATVVIGESVGSAAGSFDGGTSLGGVTSFGGVTSLGGVTSVGGGVWIGGSTTSRGHSGRGRQNQRHCASASGTIHNRTAAPIKQPRPSICLIANRRMAISP